MLSVLVFALALLVDLTNGCTQERVVTPVVLQAPSVNVQQTYAYGMVESLAFRRSKGSSCR
ncbi:MAG TPA: hypothetical protein VFQ03_04460 [Candidatus Binatia bacterium]|nr:hypothetical protein [Candidatus Binatia bacterium]